MLIKRLCLCGLLIFLIITILFIGPAWCSGTPSGTDKIAVTAIELQENMGDAEALVAENAELKTSLASERQNSAALMAKMEEYISKSDQEIKLLKEQNTILQEQVVALNKKIKIEHAKGFMQGVPVGAVIGVLIAIIL